MPATRTQIYLTRAQRRQLDARAKREDKTLAQVIRDAVDHYLEGDRPADEEAALSQTFGRLPELEVPPRSEWDRGYG